MGNSCSNEINIKRKKKEKNLKDKSFTLCPLIDERKLLKEKKIISNSISCIDVIKYKNKDFILLGFDLGKIEIYDSESLEMVVENQDEIYLNEYIRYVGQLLNEYFVVVTLTYVRIFAFYLDNPSLNDTDRQNYYNIKLLQKIESPLKSKSNHSEDLFSKAFFFDRNLYREYDIHERDLDKNRRKKNKNYINKYPIDEELIIGSNKGIFIFENYKYKQKQKRNNLTNEVSEDINQFNISSQIEMWEKNPYLFREQITSDYIYDIKQVNFRYLAGTIKGFLCFYSMETYELVTKFSVKISEDCDSVIFMLKEDILCVAGKDNISLISVKDFEVILVTLIKKRHLITEICILPDYNILIGMQKESTISLGEKEEYFYQYKCFHKVNMLTKSMEYCILQVSSKLLTKNYSNITMRCLSDNRLVTVIDTNLIQIWK